jgi:ABC-type transporter Mla MlaB component
MGSPASASRIVECDVAGLPPDAVTVDALARVQLAARRNGRQVRLRNASDELLALLELAGLREVVPCGR